MLVLAGIAAMVYFATTADSRFGNRGNAENLQQLQMFAPVLGGFYVWFQYVVMCFVASTLTAPAICDERRKGSLSTLIATPLTATQIVLGKMSGRLSQLVILLLAGVPLLLAIRVFGGISAWFVVSATALTLSTALLHASIAMAASARVRSSAVASGAGFVSGILFCFLPMFIALFVNVMGLKVQSEMLLGVSPYVALGFETARFVGETPPPGVLAWSWAIACAYALVIAALFLLLAIYRFKQLAAMAGEGGLAVEPKRKQKSKSSSRAAAKREPRVLEEGLAPVGGPGPGFDAATTSVGISSASLPRTRASAADDDIAIRGNPVLWRELRQSMFLRWWHPWVVVVFIGSLLALAYAQAGLREPVPMFMAQIALTAIFLFQACVVAAGSIAGERESRSLETLLTTPLTARSIVLAKWLGAVRRMYPLPLLSVAIIFILGVLPGTFHWRMLPHYALIVLPPAAALAASGVWLSVVTRKTSVAATLNVLLAFAFWAGVPFVMSMLMLIVNFGRGMSNAGQTVLGTVLISNPGPMLITALIGASEPRRGSSSYHTFLNFTPETFLLACIGSTVFFGLVSALFLHLAALGLSRRTNRRA
ncbi:MAG: ABC transporter permease [Phycisphaerales bacterium]|nr:ABC transporter permease [Phycisphaerales bacterium]